MRTTAFLVSAILVYFLACAAAFALDPSKALSQHITLRGAVKTDFRKKNGHGNCTNGGPVSLAGDGGGLVRFEGRNFLTFSEKNAPGLGDRFVRSLATGPDTLWIGTMSGLVRYHDGKFQIVPRYTRLFGSSPSSP
jgi:hypothetical protein